MADWRIEWQSRRSVPKPWRQIRVTAADGGRSLARAVADLTELSELSLPLLRPGGLLVAWKRLPLEAELDRADRAVRQLGGRLAGYQSVAVHGLEDHVLAVVEKIVATPTEFPRDPAARRRRPL